MASSPNPSDLLATLLFLSCTLSEQGMLGPSGAGVEWDVPVTASTCGKKQAVLDTTLNCVAEQMDRLSFPSHPGQSKARELLSAMTTQVSLWRHTNRGLDEGRES